MENFNRLVHKNLEPIFKQYGFRLYEEHNNLLRYVGTTIIISLVYDEKDRSSSLFIDYRPGTWGEPESIGALSDVMLDKVFHSGIKINRTSRNMFVRNLFEFFTDKGVALLEEKHSTLDAIITLQENLATEYTDSITRSYYLKLIDKAWSGKDYKSVVQYLDKIGLDHVPGSYGLKYKIALKKKTTDNPDG